MEPIPGPNSPSELSGQLVDALHRFCADGGLEVAQKPRRSPAATVHPPPRHLPSCCRLRYRVNETAELT